MRILHRRPDHATVVSYLALFVALGGTGAYAANTIGSSDIIDESIQSVDLKNGEVKWADIGVNQVTGSRIADLSVVGADLAADSVGSSQVAADAIGSSEVATSSLTASELATNSVEGTEVAGGAIDSDEIADGLLNAPDIGRLSGKATLDFSTVGTSICHVMGFDTGVDIAGDMVVVSPTYVQGLAISSRPSPTTPTRIDVIACRPFGDPINPTPQQFTYLVVDH